MSEGLDVIIVDDEDSVCKLISTVIKKFYTWGNIHEFTDVDDAITYCLTSDMGIALSLIHI